MIFEGGMTAICWRDFLLERVGGKEKTLFIAGKVVDKFYDPEGSKQ